MAEPTLRSIPEGDRARRSEAVRLLLGAAFALAWMFGLPGPATAAPKTDRVAMRNGDRITCEIRQLDRGRLQVKTDDMGTLDIEWDKVDSVRASATFLVEDAFGALHYGPLRGASRSGLLGVGGDSGVRVIDMLAVVRISRLGETFIKRLDGSIDLGTSYTSASDLFAFDFVGEVSYERRGNELDLDVSSNVTRQPEVEETRRWSGSLNFVNRRPSRWLVFGQGLAEGNRELGFLVRGSFSSGMGRYFVQGLHDEFLSQAGLSVNQEVPVEGETTENVEFLLGFQYDRFSYDFPKVDILVKATGYASLTQAERVRAELDARLKREVFKDFNLSLRFYESYDSKPPTAGSPLNDYGLTFGVGWTF